MALDLQYDLVNLSPADASPVEANFNRTQTYINTELIDRAGTTAMTGQLKLVGNPVAPLDAATKQYVDAVLPLGVIMMYGGSSAPPGGRWALCNGAELQVSDYPDLFAVIGTSYGSGGAGRFNLPNMTNNFARGGAPGATGGTKDAVVVPHTHPIDHTVPASATGSDAPDHVHAGVDHLHNFSVFSSVGVTMPWGEVYQAWPNPPDNVDSFRIALAAEGNAFSIVIHKFLSTSFHGEVNATGTTAGADRSLMTGGRSAFHNHPTPAVAVSATSGAASGAVASGVDQNLPPYVGVNHIMRVS